MEVSRNEKLLLSRNMNMAFTCRLFRNRRFIYPSIGGNGKKLLNVSAGKLQPADDGAASCYPYLYEMCDNMVSCWASASTTAPYYRGHLQFLRSIRTPICRILGTTGAGKTLPYVDGAANGGKISPIFIVALKAMNSIIAQTAPLSQISTGQSLRNVAGIRQVVPLSE